MREGQNRLGLIRPGTIQLFYIPPKYLLISLSISTVRLFESTMSWYSGSASTEPIKAEILSLVKQIFSALYTYHYYPLDSPCNSLSSSALLLAVGQKETYDIGIETYLRSCREPIGNCTGKTFYHTITLSRTMHAHSCSPGCRMSSESSRAYFLAFVRNVSCTI